MSELMGQLTLQLYETPRWRVLRRRRLAGQLEREWKAIEPQVRRDLAELETRLSRREPPELRELRDRLRRRES